VILSGKPPDGTRRNQNLATDSASGQTPSRDEVIDRTNAEAESFSGVAAGIQVCGSMRIPVGEDYPTVDPSYFQVLKTGRCIANGKGSRISSCTRFSGVFT